MYANKKMEYYDRLLSIFPPEWFVVRIAIHRWMISFLFYVDIIVSILLIGYSLHAHIEHVGIKLLKIITPFLLEWLKTTVNHSTLKFKLLDKYSMDLLILTWVLLIKFLKCGWRGSPSFQGEMILFTTIKNIGAMSFDTFLCLFKSATEKQWSKIGRYFWDWKN